eukprot:365573-Chlamydomonas_euryale.AAC.19
MEERLDPTKRYILAEFPHGTFPIAPIVASTLFQTLFPHVPVYSVAASSLFYIPFWRHFIAWVGSLPATKESFTKLLKKGSVAVVLGGIAEVCARSCGVMVVEEGVARTCIHCGPEKNVRLTRTPSHARPSKAGGRAWSTEQV